MMGGLRADRSSFKATRQGKKGTPLNTYLATLASLAPVEITRFIRIVVNEKS
jgi:hypothetical protein